METRDALIGAILVDVSESLRELRCASTERFVKHGVSMTQIHVLRQLEQHGAMSMSRIAELLDVSLSNATGLIDRMVERGRRGRHGLIFGHLRGRRPAAVQAGGCCTRCTI